MNEINCNCKIETWSLNSDVVGDNVIPLSEKRKKTGEKTKGREKKPTKNSARPGNPRMVRFTRLHWRVHAPLPGRAFEPTLGSLTKVTCDPGSHLTSGL